MQIERKKLDLSRERFAEIIGISDYYIGQLERGERQMSLPVAVKICKHLRVPLDYIVLGSNDLSTSHLLENKSDYNLPSDKNRLKADINTLLFKCSKKELELIKSLIRTILPYL